MTVLVTGATGNVGAAAVEALRRRGATVRAFVRRPVDLPGVEVAIGDFEDPGSIRAALDGVDRVLLSSADGPRKVDHEAAVIDAARGVELIVKASTISAQAGSPLPPFDWNGRSEDHLRRSGIAAVVLRSAFYMSNLLAVAEPVREQRVLPAPAGDGRIAMIDPRDVGAVAAAVLTGDGHAGRTYELTGPEPVTYGDVAAAIARATGAPVRYVDVPPAAARDGLVAAGMPDWLVAHLDGAFAKIRAGEFAPTTGTVYALTGHRPRDLDAFIAAHAGAFAPVAQPA
ncbi:MAG TPA: SDR family oxidoreductase [Solirubrobacteraceae bacterium]|nr:SDR family oxidoreductase [Solirubrobacteraceae bacterium]